MAVYHVTAQARTPALSGPPTLVEIGPIHASGLNWTEELNRPGSIQFSCDPASLSDDIKARLVDLRRFPLEVKVWRDSTVVALGHIQSYTIQATTLSVYCSGLLSYLSYMLIQADYFPSGVDQAVIVKTLVETWQNLDYGNFGLATSGIAAHGVPRDGTYKRDDLRKVSDVINQIAERDNAFDYYVNPATRALVLVNPQRGTDLSNTVFLDYRNITDPSVSVSVAPADVASDAFVTSMLDDGVTLYGTASNASTRQSFGRSAIADTYQDVSNQATLDGHASELLATRAEQLFIPGPNAFATLDADVDDFTVGDTVRYSFDAGLGLTTMAARVVKRRIAIDNDGAERINVEFT